MKQAMIFAAGLGTRLRPLTDTMPKALVPVGGKPLLWHLMTKLQRAGFERVVVNVHHFAEQIVGYLAENSFGMDVRISDERTMLLETGGGIKKTLPLFEPDSPILIHNVDILSNVDFDALMSTPTITASDALLLVSQRKTKRYLLFDNEATLKGWTNLETGEVKGPNPNLDLSKMNLLAFSGIHVIWPQVFHLFEDMPERFGIIDFYLKYCSRYAFHGYEKKDLRLMDVGKLETLGEADAFLKTLLT